MNQFAQRGMHVPGDSKRGVRGVLAELFSYSEKLKLPVAVSLLFAVAGAVLTIVGPNLLSRITDLISNSLAGEIDLAAIGHVGVQLLHLCGALYHGDSDPGPGPGPAPGPVPKDQPGAHEIL